MSGHTWECILGCTLTVSMTVTMTLWTIKNFGHEIKNWKKR